MQSIVRSVVFKVVVGCSLAAVLPIAASAAKIVLCSTCDPVPIPITPTNNALDQVQASATTNGNLSLEFINLTGVIMDNLVFGTTIDTGLNTAQLEADSDFTCLAPDGYFLSCMVTYDPVNGALTYDYFNVNPPSILDTPLVVLFEDFVGGGFGNTGIPNLGVFTVQMAGWTGDLTDPVTGQQLYGTPGNPFPTFVNGFNVPEPSAALILMTELLLLGGFLTLFGRKLKWKQHFDL
jgi:hypothetical protein